MSISKTMRDLNAIKELTSATRRDLTRAESRFALDNLNAIDDRVERIKSEYHNDVMDGAEKISRDVMSEFTQRAIKPCLYTVRDYILSLYRYAPATLRAHDQAYNAGALYASLQALAGLMDITVPEASRVIIAEVESVMLETVEGTDGYATDYDHICDKWDLTADEAYNLHLFLVHEVAENQARAGRGTEEG